MKTLPVPIAIMLALVCFAAPAKADHYGFSNISANSVGNADIGEAQLFVNVEAYLGQQNRVVLTFLNNGSNAASITDVYFEDAYYGGSPVLAGLHLMTTSGQVSFSVNAAPPNLPSANSASPAFVTTSGFSYDSDAPVQPNGINPGESLSLVFDLNTGMTVNDVLAALSTGYFRIGIHVQGFADGGSESFVNDPTPIPSPGATVLAMGGLCLVGLHRRRLMSPAKVRAD